MLFAVKARRRTSSNNARVTVSVRFETGEICVYGINEIPKMTQVTTQEMAKVVCPLAQKATVFPAAVFRRLKRLLFSPYLFPASGWANFGASGRWIKATAFND